jgi:hypothetical protein
MDVRGQGPHANTEAEVRLMGSSVVFIKVLAALVLVRLRPFFLRCGVLIQTFR